MPDIKANYDRYLLAVLGVVAAGAFVLLAGAASQEREQAVVSAAEIKKEAFAPDAAVELLKADRSALASRKSWEPGDASPFVSRVYLLKDGRLVDIMESGNDLFPGISNAWLIENDLDYLDDGLPERDPDSDGFTNFEEFTAKTNPRDAASKPALWTKLRLIDSKIDKLRFRFMSLPKGTPDIVAINTTTADNPLKLSGSTQFYPRSAQEVKTAKTSGGETISDPRILILAERTAAGDEVFEPTPFKFERVEMTQRFNPYTNNPEEVPVVILLNTADGKNIRLTREEIADSPYPLATFLDTRIDGKTYQVRSGGIIQLGDADRFKLVDVTTEGATIEDLGTGEKHTIPKTAAPPPADEPSVEQEAQ